MHRKSQRILWLLNHKTLMPYEAPLIMDLGFEVFVPKKVPKTNFRSAAVSFDYDKSLTIPKAVLDRLNDFDFYLAEWPPDIVRIVNRYFGTIFVIPYGKQVIEAITHFDGELVFRAFGLDNERTYNKVLEDMYGRGFFHRLESVRERFWFGEGYDHLHEVESPLFKDKSLFLPIGIPDSFFRNEGKWRGTQKKILFVAPNVVTDPYYAKVYKDFKRDFGDLPHVIVGQQDTLVDDPHMAGFVSDEELQNLYLDCAAFYYHSRELRHVHYSPIEAAINGMPLVYFKDSLLGRMCPGSVKGRVSTVDQAREILQKILSGDDAFIRDIREDQKDVAFHFSNAYCKPVWKENLEKSGILGKLAQQSLTKTIGREVQRSMAQILGRRIDNSTAARPLPSAEIAKKVTGSSLADGIFFNHANLPVCVMDIQGISEAEPWGRWSDAERVVISLNHMLENEFILDITAVGYDRNSGADIKVKIGSSSQLARFGADVNNPQSVSLPFRLKKLTNVIEFTVPYPIQPVNDNRMIGLGLVRLEVRPFSPATKALSLPQARPLRADAVKLRECNSFVEAGVAAASISETAPAAQLSTLPPDAETAFAESDSDGRPTWRRVSRLLIRRVRPVLLPFSNRFRGHVRTAIEETAVLPHLSQVTSDLSQVMAEIASLRQEIARLRGTLDTHLRQVQVEAKADRATLHEMSAVLPEALKSADGVKEFAPGRTAMREDSAEGPKRPLVEGS